MFFSRPHLQKSSTILLFSGLALATGCSSDAIRFEDMLGDRLVTNSVRTQNQQTIIASRGASAPKRLQSFGGSPTSTARAGVQRAVSTPAKLPSPSYTAPKLATAPQISTPSIPAYQLPPVTETQPVRNTVISRTINNALGRESVTTAATATSATPPVILQPRTTNVSPLRKLGADPVTTASVKAPRSTGWSADGGSAVTIRSGETLHNLSRRFGVPVKAIMAANGLSSPTAVAAGQRVVIPAYTYGQKSTISAPDSDPDTRVSRATSGYQGQATGPITTPKRRARPTQAPIVAAATKSAPTTTAQSHVVQPGQTLYAISRKYNVRMGALRLANGLSGDSLKQGQRLTIPGEGFLAASNGGDGVDMMTTSSVPTARTTPKTVTRARSVPPVQVAAAKTTAPRASNSKDFIWPISGRTITKFGAPTPTGANDGIDISVPSGTPIKAARSGTVIYSGSELEDFGKLVLLSHANGYVTAYAHASSTLVKRGQTVNAGQVIAKSGATGNATEPKLHFEIRKNSQPVNPLTYLPR